MPTIPGIPDRDVAPATIPSYLEKVQAVLAVETHLVVGQMNVLLVLVCPIFEKCVRLRVSDNNNIQGFTLLGVVRAH
jgi:hypothetical protein